MSASPPTREALLALLDERARLLAPGDEMLARVLKRCLRHQLRERKRYL